MLVDYGDHPRTVLRMTDDFGFETYDVVSIPRRICHPTLSPPLIEMNIDKRRVRKVRMPSELMSSSYPDSGDSWLGASGRALARIYAAFLIAEDPQRRLDARKAATLMHQISLVQHILEKPELRKVLIGDEVGLGKTIEAGLLIQQLISQNPTSRILYLAPARLVANVSEELREKLDIDVRKWVAGVSMDARLESDRVVVASIHKAAFGDNLEKVAKSGPWDVVIVDECHHLSDWDPAGGKPNQSFKLVSQLVKAQRPEGRLILMSGTPHQGSEARFKNILRLLADDGASVAGAAGRVIYRTKDRVRDWRGAPLFPAREIRQPVVVQLGRSYEQWYLAIGALYDQAGANGVRSRAAGWAKGQALQWAASSVHAGLAFLVRLSIRRLNWTLAEPSLGKSLAVLRPYRGGSASEAVTELYERIRRQVGDSILEFDDDDSEEPDEQWRPDPALLEAVLQQGVELIEGGASNAKWEAVCKIIDDSNQEKIVLFAQPVETVTLVAAILEKRYGVRPAMIIGNQSDEERAQQVNNFQSDIGPRFLVSSRAGGEGLNMQRARRLIHLDVPWNPMELEQRIGRIHRFGSRKTVLIDTVVASGSREVDMYRIAREKLGLIARHLDPDQFETLFSRVMSLVPPKELETILGDVTGPSPFDGRATQEIGRLVSEGFASWSSFDEQYRKQAADIRAVSSGEAEWNDLGAFLVKYGAAKPGAGAAYNAFEFQDNEIVAVDERVPTLVFRDQIYACGDTGGLLAFAEDGSPARPLGLNLDEVQQVLRNCFSPEAATGLAYVNRPVVKSLLSGQKPAVALAFVKQTLHQERGRWSEKAIALHVYLAGEDGLAYEIDSKQRADFVRALQSTSRVKDPSNAVPKFDIRSIEAGLMHELRRPSDREIDEGIRHAVWPLAAVVLVS